MVELIINLILVLAVFIPLLMAIAFLTLFERKILASMQRRKGPNKVGMLGLMQPFADGLKLYTKETVIPGRVSKPFFLASPVYLFFLSLMSWTIVPYAARSVLADLNISLLFLLGIIGMNVYGLLLAGWSSNSRYAFLGALRAAAQMIAYEISMSVIVMLIIMKSNSVSLVEIVYQQCVMWNIWFFFGPFIMFFICSLAECNRTPFDLVESESELVAGVHVEYSAAGFTLIFLAEYSNMMLLSHVMVLLFLGGWLPPSIFQSVQSKEWLFFSLHSWWYACKFVCILGLFVWVRGTYGRLRYDQLMSFGWKYVLPFSLFYICVYVFFHYLFL